MAVDLLLLLGEGRRREPRRLAAEVPVALLLLEEGEAKFQKAKQKRLI